MIAPLKAGILVGVILIGAVPPTLILVRGWDILEPLGSLRSTAIARVYGPPIEAKPAASVATIAPSVTDDPAARLKAGFETVAEAGRPAVTSDAPASQAPDRPAPSLAPLVSVKTIRVTGPATTGPDLHGPATGRTTPTDTKQPLLPPVPTTGAGLPPTGTLGTPLTQVAAINPASPLGYAPVSEPFPAPMPGNTANPPNAALRALIISEAKADHIPEKLALAVVEIESGFDAGKTGEDGKVGLFQIRPAIAKALGFKGSVAELQDPAVNIKWGMKYLAGAYKRADGDTCKTAMKFVGGHYQQDYKPIHAAYCKTLEEHMAAIK